MKILFINTRDRQGGAALSMYDLYSYFKRREGNDIRYLVMDKSSTDPGVEAFRFKEGLFHGAVRRYKRLKNRTVNPKNRFDLVSDCQTYFGDELVAHIGCPDVIVLNWVAGFIDLASFFGYVIEHNIPVLWRLADLNTFTGGCHVDYDCGRYTRGCGHCPQIQTSAQDDITTSIWKSKMGVFSKVPKELLKFVVLSDWERSKAKASPLINQFEMHTILNGVNQEYFSFKDKNACKTALGITSNGPVFLLVAEFLDIWYKGTQQAVEALELLGREFPDVLLLTIGKAAEIETGLDHISFGEIINRRIMSLIYGATDYFIFPSHYETFGRTFQEAMACGTPVIGFRTGGIPHLVEHGVNGFITKDKTTTQLYETLVEALNTRSSLDSMSRNASEKALEYSLEVQGAQYFDLCEQMVNDNPSD